MRDLGEGIAGLEFLVAEQAQPLGSLQGTGAAVETVSRIHQGDGGDDIRRRYSQEPWLMRMSMGS